MKAVADETAPRLVDRTGMVAGKRGLVKVGVENKILP